MNLSVGVFLSLPSWGDMLHLLRREPNHLLPNFITNLLQRNRIQLYLVF